jgi:hypothetical protein
MRYKAPEVEKFSREGFGEPPLTSYIARAVEFVPRAA